MYSKQHKRKALLTRISSILLSATIAFTSLPVTNVYAEEKTNPTSKSSDKTSNTGSFADDIAGSSGTKKGEGSTNQAETLEGSLYGLDFSQGLRFYLVNQDLERITDCYNFLFDEKFTNYTYKAAYNETRFDTPDSPQNHKYYSMSKLQEWCTIEKTTEYEDPKPPLVGLECKGAEFKDWLRNGLAMTGGPGGLLNYGSANVNNSGVGTGSTGSTGTEITKKDPLPLPVVDKPTDKIELGDSLYDGNINYSDVIDYYSIEVKPVASGITNDIAGIGQQAAYEQAYRTALSEAERKAKEVAMSIRDRYKATYNEKVKYYGNNNRSMSLHECKLAALADIKGRVNNATGCETVRTITYRYLYNYCGLNETDIYTVSSSSSSTALYINNQSDLLSTNIPLANEDFSNATEQQANSPIFCMTNKSDTLVIYDTVKYGTNAASAMIEHGCYIVIEPVLICKIMRQSGIHNYQQSCLAKHYDADYSIGSVWNIIHNWGGTATSSYTPRLESYFPNSFITTKLYESPTGKKILPVEDPNANFYTNPENRMAELEEAMPTLTEAGGQVKGIAMHIFSALDLFSDSSTQTYDKGLGETIGQAPDPTNLPTESQYPISKNITIIKNYVTVDSLGNETVDGNFIRNQNPHIIQILDEPLYKVVDWQTDNKTTSILSESDNGNTTITYNQLVQNSSKIQSGTTENVVQLSENEFVLYVKLLKSETPPPSNTRLTGDYILNESELAKAFQITPIQIQYQFPDIYMSASHGSHSYNHRPLVIGGITQKNADGSTKYTSDDCDSISTYGSDMVDNEVKVKIKNTEESNYSNIIVQSDKAKFNSQSSIEILHRNSQSVEEKTGSNTYTFSIYRYQQGEQNLVLAKYNQKQSSNKDVSVGVTQAIDSNNINIIKTLGYQTGNTKTSKTRADVDYIVNAVKFKFIHDMANSPDNYTKSKLASKGTDCGTTIGGGEKNLAVSGISTVESEADISVQVYSGTSNKQLHTKLWTETIGRNGEKYLPIRDNNNKTVGRQVQSTSTIKFNPFIKMVYSTVDDLKNNTIKKYPVNVLSEYQREILNTDYAEVAWQYQANSANLSLLSNMWATDTVLVDGDDIWRQPNQVLKGGASAALQIKDSDMRALTLRTYQTVFPDSDINDYLINATNYSVDKAVTEHDAFIQSAVDTFEQLHIVQRVSTRIEDSIDDMADENKVERGGNISFLNNNSNTASSDSKYYLSKDLSGLNTGADEGDLDVKLGSTSKKFFKVWSDTSGNILIAEGTDINALKNNISGTVILTKNQDSSSLTNQTAIDLNNRTFIVDKLINAVERNTGNDPTAEWVSDAKWYNESFAVYCMVQSTDIRLGFRDVSTRAFVLDAKLCPYLSSKSQQGKTAHTSIFSTDSFSEKWGSSEEGRVGTFKGKPIYMEDMQRLFTSKLFFIPNMTVQGSR